MTKISTAQKTFVDLYDSYVLNLSSDVVAVPCDQYGAATGKYTITIDYTAAVGTKDVACACVLNTTAPSGVTVNTTNGIKIEVAKGTNFNDDLKLQFTFTTQDAGEFVFVKYITFIKIKSGERIVTFRVYSENGDTFKEDLDSITLKTTAYDGLTAITNATYKWYMYDTATNNWSANPIGTGATLAVERPDSYSNYALESVIIKCECIYNGKSYVDYFSLKSAHHTYTSVVKFFNGSNIFNAAEQFLVAYIELYKDQKKEESIQTDYYFYHPNNTYNVTTASYSSIDNLDIDAQYKKNGTLMYVIYRVTNSNTVGAAKYKVCLHQYDASGKSWKIASSAYASKYIYKNDLYNNLYENIFTNIIVISKEDISRQRDINFTIYHSATNVNQLDDDLIVARASTTVIDLNDPIVSAEQPTNVREGQLWLNIGVNPYTLYIFQDNKWEYFTQQKGKTIHTSKPSSYAEGDIWIINSKDASDSEVENAGFGDGSMLRATQSSNSFSISHWEDAQKHLSSLMEIQQYITTDPTQGLTIRNSNNFYINMKGDAMNFYDNSEGKNAKVIGISSNADLITDATVGISGDTAHINNATLKGNTNFYGNMNMYQVSSSGTATVRFKWTVESDGSLSLVVAN